ncbi:MAG: phosphatidate cytidylyltransferase [Flavobacteriaceae bacterium]|nr:phosphatidate cytidylyltransferase [Flavobacteriaceae bacterium]OUV87055.1 MAG: phosphatidate cytidylyltransferase [Flavobacteriaceae bacterium TMED145]
MKESNKRIISGLVFGGLFISSLYTHVSFALLTFIFGIISTNEFNKLTNQKGIGYYLVFSLIYIYFALTEYLLNINNQPNSWFNDLKDTLLIFSIFVSLFLLRDLFSTKNLTSILIKKYFRFIFYITSSFIFIYLIANFNGFYDPSIILGCFILIWVNDSFAYMVGKKFGKQKLFYSISPHKTVEGFLGGLLFCCISASLVSRYVDDSISTSNWLTMAIIVSVFGTLGDLIESKFKRESNVKDSGKIMPGHGGILDRLDSIIFASPYIYLFLKLI